MVIGWPPVPLPTAPRLRSRPPSPQEKGISGAVACHLDRRHPTIESTMAPPTTFAILSAAVIVASNSATQMSGLHADLSKVRENIPSSGSPMS